jgi:hypothetical protein
MGNVAAMTARHFLKIARAAAAGCVPPFTLWLSGNDLARGPELAFAFILAALFAGFVYLAADL